MTETELEYHFCFNCNERKQCYTKPKDCTRIKEEIGLQEMTNEEWLKSMDTEQFAEALAWIEDRGELPTVRKENVKAFEEWLKEIHE